MSTGTLWQYSILFLLTLSLVGCYHHDDDYRDTTTEVVCSSDSACDLSTLTCTSTFDEIYTEFIDEYNDDFDRHTTITEDTILTRIDDIDPTFALLASSQTETFVVTTTEDEVIYDHDGDEHVTITTTEERVVTTWTQDCPTCLVEVCTSSGSDPFATCSLIPDFPPFPQCRS